jgi:integrase
VAKKRGNGEGSITRYKDGRWCGRYTIHTANGPKRKAVYGKTRQEAAEKLAKALADLSGGLLFDATNLTLGDFLERWLSESVRHSVKPNTYESYSQLTRRHIIPALGRNKLKKLTPAHVRRFRTSALTVGLSARTVQYLLTLLREALQQAVEDGLIPRNAAQGVRVKQTRKEEIHPLSSEQVGTLLGAATGERLEALYVVAIHSGLRQGELLGLKWEDVNLDAGTLQVRRTLSGGNFTPPKTAKSRRSVKLTAGAAEALKEHRDRQLEERESLTGIWRDHDLVFCSTIGTPLNRHNLIPRSFKPLLQKAGLPRTVRFHDLRHTCATLLLSKGVHPKFVQELLGHATISITLDTYSHVLPGMGDHTAAAMESALSEPSSEGKPH